MEFKKIFSIKLLNNKHHLIINCSYFKKKGDYNTFIKVISEDLQSSLKRIMAPTLLIWGENDKDTPIYMGKIMEKEIRDAGLVILKNAGHYSYLDQFRQFCVVINNFLQARN